MKGERKEAEDSEVGGDEEPLREGDEEEPGFVSAWEERDHGRPGSGIDCEEDDDGGHQGSEGGEQEAEGDALKCAAGDGAKGAAGEGLENGLATFGAA